MTRDDASFLSRWSRRKRATPIEEPEAPPPDEETVPPAEQPDEVDEPKSDAEILEALGLKDPDALGPGDDFRAFMQKAVPDHLRRRALRRLWTSDPILANLDGLNDYDGDFTGGTVAPGALKTLYQVGRGFVTQAGREDDEPGQVAGEADTPDTDGVPRQTALAEPEEAPRDEADAEEEIAEEQAPPSAGARRRMQFRFET